MGECLAQFKFKAAHYVMESMILPLMLFMDLGFLFTKNGSIKTSSLNTVLRSNNFRLKMRNIRIPMFVLLSRNHLLRIPKMF